jgi:hypothetical protein
MRTALKKREGEPKLQTKRWVVRIDSDGCQHRARSEKSTSLFEIAARNIGEIEERDHAYARPLRDLWRAEWKLSDATLDRSQTLLKRPARLRPIKALVVSIDVRSARAPAVQRTIIHYGISHAPRPVHQPQPNARCEHRRVRGRLPPVPLPSPRRRRFAPLRFHAASTRAS